MPAPQVRIKNPALYKKIKKEVSRTHTSITAVVNARLEESFKKK